MSQGTASKYKSSQSGGVMNSIRLQHFPHGWELRAGLGGDAGEDGCTADRASERHGGKDMQISGHMAED